MTLRDLDNLIWHLQKIRETCAANMAPSEWRPGLKSSQEGLAPVQRACMAGPRIGFTEADISWLRELKVGVNDAREIL